MDNLKKRFVMGKIERGLMKLTRAELIEIFKNGNIPQGSDYEALFNSIYLLDEGKYITGYTKQEIDDMIAPLNAMKDEGYVYAGIAHPSDPKKEHKAKVFYYATEVGDYKGYLDSGGQYIKKANHGVSILKNVSAGVWEIEDVMVIAQELGDSENVAVSQKTFSTILSAKDLAFDYGYYISNSGRINTYDTCSVTELLRIPPQDKKCIINNGWALSTDIASTLVFLDENYNIVGYYNASGAILDFNDCRPTLPQDAKFFIIQYQEKWKQISIEIDSSIIKLRTGLSYQRIREIKNQFDYYSNEDKYGDSNIKSITQQALTEKIPHSERTKNLYNPNSIIENRYIDNGGNIADVQNWAITNYIPVKPNTNYYITAKSVGRASGFAWFDENKKKIIGSGDDIYNRILTSPENAHFLQFNLKQSKSDYSKGIMMVEGDMPLPYEPYRIFESEQVDGFSEVLDNNAQLAERMNGIDQDIIDLKSFYPVFSTYDSYHPEYLRAVLALSIHTETDEYNIDNFTPVSILYNYSGRYELKISHIGSNGETLGSYGFKLNPNSVFNMGLTNSALQGVIVDVAIDYSKLKEEINNFYTKDYSIPKVNPICFNNANPLLNKEYINQNTQKIDELESKIVGSSNSLTIENSDKILFTGCSYDESLYALAHKNYFDKLSNLTDWICGNIGISGYRIIDIVKQLRDNRNTYSITPKEFKPTYITIANNGNETLPTSGDNLNLYWEQARMANDIIKSLGAKMILGTNYHTNGNPFVEPMLKAKADELGIPYMGIGWICKSIMSRTYRGFWGGSHPGTRANSAIWNEWMFFMNQMKKPKKSIKIFRPRKNAQLNELNYDSNIQRFERWIEINIGGMCLNKTDGSEARYDRLDEGTEVDPNDENNVVRVINGQSEHSEYAKLIRKENVPFKDAILIEMILDKSDIDYADILIKGDAGVVWYIKNNNAPNTYIDCSRQGACFQVTKEVYDSFNYEVGTLFKTSKYAKGGINLGYTGKLKSHSMGDGWFLCFDAQGSYSSDKQSGSGELLLVSNPSEKVLYEDHKVSYRYSYEFFKTMFTPNGEFEEISSSYTNGVYSIKVSKRENIAYDKIKLIGIKSGDFNISDMSCEYSGGVDKEYKTKEIKMREQGTEQITNRGFGANWNTSDGWIDGGNVRVEMPADVRCYPPYLSTNSHISLGLDANGFPKKISKEINIDTSQNLAYKKLIVRCVVRLFPKIYNPEKVGTYYTSTPQISPNTFDYSNLCVELTSGDNIPMVKKSIVDIDWVLTEVEIPLPPRVSNFKINIYRDIEELIGHESDNFEMQLADVSVQLL